ncbi:Tigger transposable element-derived protein 6 [Frankliniella fusca]|uniref:Tigger transposable element-derived protein 6 n=1 Tax=Frankliniella fusca TaxID=407009 RepID=A0AAE1I3Q0_9NEOP|nr:Tigger transposable element-derived protein 6 [Frankliniella fusca]
MHSDIAMRTALKFCRQGMKVRQAAKETGVDRMTLTRYIKKYGNYDKVPEDINLTSNFNSKQIFNENQESDLVAYVLLRSSIGYGLTSTELRECAYEVGERNGVKMPQTWILNKSAGLGWYKAFMKRHPQLSARKPEQCSVARAAAFNAVNISNYFDKLKSVLERQPNFQDGTRVFNLDKKSVSTVGVLKEKIISPKGLKQVHQAKGQERGTSMTMCGMISASGQALPPVLIFPRVNFTKHMLVNCYPGTLGLANKAGYMTKELFVPTIKHFIQHSKSSKEDPTLLIVDNVGSHLSLEVINLCKENGVTLFTLPPHTTHKTQPLDVGIFGPFETAYNKVVHQWQQENPGCCATIYNIASFTNVAWGKSATPTNIFSAFKATGISPFNKDIFGENDFMPSLVTKDQGHHASKSTSEENLNNLDVQQQQGAKTQEEKGGEGENENEEEVDDPDAEPETNIPAMEPRTHVPAVEILGIPKAQTPKSSRTNRRKGKCMVATDTPEKKAIEDRETEIRRKNEEKLQRKKIREEKKAEKK